MVWKQQFQNDGAGPGHSGCLSSNSHTQRSWAAGPTVRCPPSCARLSCRLHAGRSTAAPLHRLLPSLSGRSVLLTSPQQVPASSHREEELGEEETMSLLFQKAPPIAGFRAHPPRVALPLEAAGGLCGVTCPFLPAWERLAVSPSSAITRL